MRGRGHAWSDAGEMTAAMLSPMFALVVPVELGVAGYVPGLSEDSLMMLSHVAMIGGMVALMVYRRDATRMGRTATARRRGPGTIRGRSSFGTQLPVTPIAPVGSHDGRNFCLPAYCPR